ncbi:hypothetical protein [Zavarzinia aquatilis]|uniref:N-acetyltransferase domain-containing protein n=1 Tax=Zavarzinia aquatilis TaxID=2211142 RepID=A0A317EFB2_9PROT|nr:hypothetical protein [Zavarzinia aquatilis]PWR24984.1 hypothetical protein DKG74_04235 [Zavarzinia aquatilis]
MIEIVPFIPSHLALVDLQPAQAEARALIAGDYAAALAEAGPAVSLAADRQLRGCMGLAWQWPGRAVVWAMLSDRIGPSGMVALSLRAARWLDSHDWRRIEAHVAPDHAAGHRWVSLFGFIHEARLRRYTPTGGDVDLYALTRGGV